MFFSRYFTPTHINKIIPMVTRSWDPSKTQLAQRILRCANYLPLSWVLWLATPWIKQAIKTDNHPVEFLSTLLRGNFRYRTPFVTKPVLKTIKRLQWAEFDDFLDDFITDTLQANNDLEQVHGMETLKLAERLSSYDKVRRRVELFYAVEPSRAIYRLCNMRYPPSFTMLSEVMRRYNINSMLCEKVHTFLRDINDEHAPSSMAIFYRDHGRARSVSPSDSFCMTVMILLNNENIYFLTKTELADRFLRNISHFCSESSIPAIAQAEYRLMYDGQDPIYYFNTPFGFRKYVSEIVNTDCISLMHDTPCDIIKAWCLKALAANISNSHRPMAR